ncbi:MAG: DHHW family protein [Raineya sp.]
MKSKILLIRFGTYTFVAVLLVFGALFAILPKQKVSENEKRDLASMPKFSWASLFSGKFTDSLDIFVSDNFPFREGFLQTNFALSQMRGFKSEVSFYQQEVVTNAGIDKIQDSTIVVVEDTFKPENEIIDGEAEKSPIRGVMIYNNMAIQMFGGNKAAAKYSAEVVNYFQETLKDKAQVYSVVVPTHQEFYLPHKYRHVSEKENIKYLYSLLKPEVKSVDVTSALYKHKSEYIYFNTDHHWTGLGAYYAYQEFCKVANLEAVPLEKMERKVINGFLGSLYWLTRDRRLKEKGDSVVYHKPQVECKVFSHPKKNPDKRFGGLLFAEFAKGGAAYSVYLGDDFSLVQVDTEVKNGRKAMFIKNSYGNAFAPYLVSHFEQIFIVDYRYWNKSLLKMIEEHKITDVILFHYSFSANTIPDLQRIKALLKGFEEKAKNQDKSSKPKKDTLKEEILPKDSLLKSHLVDKQ